MEAAPPSYEKATLIDLWDIIARYIPSNDLCSAALVCSRWHTTFTPHLWGNPASHFGHDDDHIYVALTKFKRTLQSARLLVRSQTHTLHLPPAHPELYNGPNATWLRDILDRLPSLQSLIVRGLPFFDYSALQALKYKRPSLGLEDGRPNGAVELPASEGTIFQQPGDFIPSFGLRLLDASRCSNLTASSLSQALRRFEGLLYLDLSYTLPARDPSVIKAFKRLSGLQVLKLRNIGLNDDLLKVLASSIAQRVRSLDIRNNQATDRGIRMLLDECFTIASDSSGYPLNSGQRSPALLSYLGHEMLGIYQGEDFEGFIRNAFTVRFIGRMAIEDAPDGGITHLYISGNPISVEGISGLVRSGRLHVLDAESVSEGITSALRRFSFGNRSPEPELPGAEKLTPIMAQYAGGALKFLRIDHALVTKDATKDAPKIDAEEVIQGRVELDDTAPPDPVEVHGHSTFVEAEDTSAMPQAFELPAVETPRYELPGDPMRVVVVSPPMSPRSGSANDESPVKKFRRGSAFAPEVDNLRRGSACAPEVVVDEWHPELDRTTISSPISAIESENGTLGGWWSNTPISPQAPETPLLPPLAETLLPLAEPTRPTRRPRTYSSVADERRARLNAHTATKHNLHPAMLPHLKTLILTNVPPTSPTKEVSDRLIRFIRQCAEEAQLARHQAILDYSLPPGRKGHISALKHSAEKIFALKRIVLELAADQPNAQSRRASQWQHASTKSVTEDHDSETLWSAAATDFSFFGDEEEAYPSLDSGRYAFATKEKEISSSSPPPTPTVQPAQLAQPKFDNIALLSAFRKERKIAHARNIAAGASDPDTEGFWDGAIEVIRPNMRKESTSGDYHSTRFNHGRLYN